MLIQINQSDELVDIAQLICQQILETTTDEEN